MAIVHVTVETSETESPETAKALDLVANLHEAFRAILAAPSWARGLEIARAALDQIHAD